MALLHRTTRPTFPCRADLPALDDAAATCALDALRVLVKMELVDVYSSVGSQDTRWNVWLNVTRRRVPLPEWAADWIATWDAHTPTDDGKEAR